MALTFIQQTGIVQTMDTTLDPSVSMFPFMSYSLSEWCSKIGDDKAVVITGHEQWELQPEWMVPTGSHALQLLLRGEGYRSGRAPFNPVNVTWRQYNRSSYVDICSGIQNNNYDPTDPNDWTKWKRNTGNYEYARINNSATYNIASGSYTLPNGGVWVSPQLMWVLYEDTPGKEWFYINGPVGGSAKFSFLIKRYTPLAGTPADEKDLGWTFIEMSSTGMYYVIANFSTSDNTTLWKQSNPRSWGNSDYVLGRASRDVACLLHSLPITGPAGDMLGYWSDDLIMSDYQIDDGYLYEVPGLGSYTGIGDYYLIKTGS